MFWLFHILFFFFFFFNDTATTEIYTYGHTLPLHAALPICLAWRTARHNEISQSLGPQTAFRPETISGVCASRSATCFPARCVGAAKRRGSLLDESKRFRRSWATGPRPTAR